MTMPLQYPRDWPKIIKRHFLLGLPVVGAQEPVYREICEQLSSRTLECWRQWGESKPRTEMAQFLAKELAQAADWPNANFVPEDPFILVAWDHDSCAIDDLAV